MAEVHYICGATCSGKSAYALALAQRTGAQIVNADAFQLYCGLEELTAAPSRTEREIVTHHLYGIIEPDVTLDAASYAKLAQATLAELAARRLPALVVGGSGLYLKFLSHGADRLPAACPELRAQLAERSLAELVAELKRRDPEACASLDLHNRRYVERALEICILTGHKASALRRRFAEHPPGLSGVWLRLSRHELCHRIAARTAAMLDRGAIEEVARLLAEGRVQPGCHAGRAIGFREIAAYLTGKISRAECEQRIVIATRQYAKRQETWLKRETWLTQVDWQ